MAIAALRQILQWDVSAISATLRELTMQIEQGASKLGFQTVPAQFRVPHMLGIRHPTGLPTNLAAELAQAGVFVSVRGQSMRVSPHLYNTQKDIKQLLSALSRFL